MSGFISSITHYYCILYTFYCYRFKTLEWVNNKNLVLELTQENSIKNSIQDGSPYILITHGLCSTTLAYSK